MNQLKSTNQTYGDFNTVTMSIINWAALALYWAG